MIYIKANAIFITYRYSNINTIYKISPNPVFLEGVSGSTIVGFN